ncbi:hypothetical protein BO70DRAFT_409146, partial [Aspergillus heteromorphus CBS 117.55]
GLGWRAPPFLKRGPTEKGLGATSHRKTAYLTWKKCDQASASCELTSAFHIVPPATFGPLTRVQTFRGQKVNLGGVVYYGVVRASCRFPIQSGPPRFAPYPG